MDANAKLNLHWVGKQFDDDEVRRKFRKVLMERARKHRKDRDSQQCVLTPYWHSDFNDWLIYESTVKCCGVVCTERNDEVCLFEADTTGVQTEGICCVAHFEIPTREFTPKQLKEIVPGCGEYFPLKEWRLPGGIWRIDYGPFSNPAYVKRLEWWYDEWEDIKEEDDD